MGYRILSLSAAGFVALVTLSLASPASAITYNINRTVGLGSVTGFIETDGTIGALQAGNIVNWEITIASPNVRGGSPDTFGALGNHVYLRGTSLVASAAGISFNFDTSLDIFILTKNPLGFGNSWCLGSAFVVCQGGIFQGHETISLNGVGSNEELALRSGTQVIATAVTPVPVPPALAFMAAVFAGIGLFGFRRRNC